jgi:putative hydrolase
MSGGRDLALDEDYHVHSTFSDGESSIVQNVRAARERGLRTLCLVDHVRRGTEWLPEFTAAVAPFRGLPGPRVLAGVEAKILDTSGRLDLPPGLDGIDLVLIADHQFPGEGAMARAGVPMVAGTDSHHCRDVGVYRSVRVTAGAGIYV